MWQVIMVYIVYFIQQMHASAGDKHVIKCKILIVFSDP